MGIHIASAVLILCLYLLAWKGTDRKIRDKITHPFCLCGNWMHRALFRSHPAVSEKILASALLLLFLSNLIGGLLTLREVSREKSDISCLPREQELSTSKEMEIWTEKGEKKRVTLEIPQRTYSAEESEDLFRKAKEELEEIVPGKNTSLSEVRYPLHLVTEIPGNPVSIEWMTSNPEVLDWDGSPGEGVSSDGTEVVVQAELYLGEQTEYMEFEAVVYPAAAAPEEVWNREIQQEVRSWNEGKTGDSYELPDSLGGQSVSWHYPRENTGILILFLGAAGMLAVIFGKFREGNREEQQRELQMLLDYPGLVSKMLLLLGAGLSMRKTVQRIAGDYQRKRRENPKLETRAAYEELVQTVKDMECGIAEKEAYERFGNRCDCPSYRSMSTLLVRNLQKGSRGLITLLEKEAADSFENRKRQAKIAGEKASSKLLLPMGMMLLIVLAVLIVPAFLSFAV